MGGVCGAESILNLSTIKTFAVETVSPGRNLILDKELLVDNPNLETFYMKDLNLEDNDITDYSALSNCKKLEYLCVGLISPNTVPDMPEDVEVVQEIHNFSIDL